MILTSLRIILCLIKVNYYRMNMISDNKINEIIIGSKSLPMLITGMNLTSYFITVGSSLPELKHFDSKSRWRLIERIDVPCY